MDIDRVAPFMPLEVLLPQRRQRQRPSGQEHERNLRHPFEGILLHLRHERRPPKELLIAHTMHQIGRRSDPPIETALLLDARLETVTCLQDHILNLKIPRHVHTKHREPDAERKEEYKNLQ